MPLRRRVARTLLQGGQHESALLVLRELLAIHDADPGDPELRARDVRAVEVAQFYVDANQHARSIPPPATDEATGFVVVYNVQHAVLTGLMVPLLGSMAARGYAATAVTVGTLKFPRSGYRRLNALQWSVAPDGKRFVWMRRERLAHEWTVDWAARQVVAEGINYFDYFQERLAQKARRYRADVQNDPESAKRFNTLLHQADVALSICERLLLLAAHGKPIRIVIMDSHFAPQGIIREWCTRVGRHHGIHAVVLGVGYENYYSNLGSIEATTVAVEDMTAQPELRQPFLGGIHRMRATLEVEPRLDQEPDEEVMAWICQDRSAVGTPSETRQVVEERVREVQARGKKVFVALGKVSVDFAAPGDRGFAHRDFVDWINHLVTAVAGTGNLLVVKPHPHEIRQEIVVDGVQLMRDLLPTGLPDEVVYLEHHSFNAHELAAFADVVFLWNGTASLEFSVLGVPVVAASIWAGRDYPVGLHTLVTREEFEQVLSGERELTASGDARRASATLLRLMRSEHVAIPYPYLRRAATNLAVGAPRLDVDRLSDLSHRPDPYVERVLSRFFEFA